MKKIFGFLICALLISVRVYAEDDIPTDKSYTFDRANVASVLAEFIEDEKKAEKAADKYNELSNNSENAISAVDFVDVCVAGGMNMKLADGSGYMKCLDMFMKLIEMQNLDAGGFDMYCPATGNALKSITDKTQVGDVCGGTPDTYIEYGHVTLKTDDKNGQHKYVCTCTPQSCKDGYYWNKEKYQCSVKDKEGYCVRHILGSFEYKNGKLPTDSGVGLNDWNKRNNAYYNDKYAQINASTDAFNRCVEYGANQGCRIRGALASTDVGSGFGNAKKYQVICNPENYEIAADKKVQEDKEKKHKAELEQNTSYYEVCGKDKGKGECIDNVFTRKIIGGTQVSYATGNALVKEYARVRLGDEITCGGDSYDKNIRKSGTEYFIKCKSLKDLTKYYEFKFDDLEESKNLTANTSVYNAVWHIIYNYNIAKNSHNGYDTGTKANCDAVNATFKKICNGCGTEWRESGYIETKGKKFCYDVINIADNTTCKKSSNDLNTAFDIDPFVFCKNTHNQLKNTGNLEGLLKQYLSDKSGVATYNIECYPQTLCYTGSGCEGTIGHGDDIKTCVVHGNKDYTVDFVFDDVNEFSKKLTKGALQSMACVVSGGTFAGQECIMANEQQCKKLAGSMKDICSGCKAPKWNTQTKLCELPDAATVTKLEKGKTVAMIVGGTIVAIGVTVITLGEGAPVAVLVLSGLDIIGGGIELGSQISIDGMAHDFLLKSIKCRDANCAERILKEDLQEMANIMNDMTDPEINATDTEFARLVGLIPQDSDFYKRIVEQGATLESNQKGFFDPEGWNEAQVWRAVGIGLQLSSLGSGFITKIVSSSRFANKFPKMQKMLTSEVSLAKTRYQINVLEKANKIAKDNEIVYEQLSDMDKEYYKLWKKYAPKNQTFYEFKEMFNPSTEQLTRMNSMTREYWKSHGGLEAAKDWAKNQKSYEEIGNIKTQIDNVGDDYQKWASLKRREEEAKKFVSDEMKEYLTKEEYDQWLKMPDKEKYDSHTVLDMLNGRQGESTIEEDLAALEYGILPKVDNIEKNLKSEQLRQFESLREEELYINGNYSTFDPEFSMYQKQKNIEFNEELRKATEDFDLEDTKLKEEYKNRFFNKNSKATEEDFYNSDYYAAYELVRRDIYDDMVSPVYYKYQVDVAEKFPLKNVNNVANERANIWVEILDENPELKQKLKNEFIWNSMTDEDRLDVAQQLVDKYTKKANLPDANLHFSTDKTTGGYYQTGTNDIYLNKDEQLKSNNWIIEILSHEHGHEVDALSPNNGAIGAQKVGYMENIYNNRKAAGYYVSPTEQSSYKIGATAAKKTDGALDAQKQRNMEFLKAEEQNTINMSNFNK